MAYPVYNMILGVSAAWVGLALMIPRIWDAITDPIMGKISDNFQSKYGRRKPFIVCGAITMGTLFALLWQAPSHWSHEKIIAYFIIAQILYFTAYTVYSVPYSALSYELTPDYNERTRVMAFVAFFHKLGEFSGGWLLPLAYGLGGWWAVSAATEEEQQMAGVTIMSWIVGLGVMAVMGAIPGLFVKERFAQKTQKEKVKLWESIKGAFSSSAFLILVSVIVLNTLSGVLAMGIDQYLLVYYMNNGDQAAGMVQKGLLTSGYAIVGFASIPIITWLAGKLSKKKALYMVYGLMTLGGIMKWFIFTPSHTIYQVNLGFGPFAFDPIILVDPLLCGPMWVAVKIMLASMMADICDEDELKSGQRREGMFGAVFSWIEKMVVSLSYMGTGVALAMANFDPKLGGHQTEETFTLMRLFLSGAPAITACAAIIALYFYPIDANRAAITRASLEKKRGAL